MSADRNAEKAEKAAAEISKATGNKHVEAFHADLSSLSQTRKLAEDLKKAHPDIDVLINNAGDKCRIQLSVRKLHGMIHTSGLVRCKVGS